MINLNPYKDDFLGFHKEVVKSKKKRKEDVQYKSRINALTKEVEPRFKEYSALSNPNCLKSINPSNFNDEKKADLLSLYRYKSKAIQKLETITTTIGNRKFNTCQMCTIEPVGTMDHILPKEKFPEFAVNPLNLFPACSKCNSTKGTRWVKGGKQIFLNLYLETIPTSEYLKIDFVDFPFPVFSIDKSKVDSDVFDILSSHYEELNLFERFAQNAYNVIDLLVASTKASLKIISLENFKMTTIDTAENMRNRYGVNHWESLLNIALVTDPRFEQYVKSET